MSIKSTFINVIILPFLIVMFAFFVYNIIDIFEITKNVEIKNNQNCKVIRGGKGLEDFAQFDSNHLIGISNDNLKLWEMKNFGVEKTQNGKVFVFDMQNENLKLYDIIGFPENIAFHPHGIYLYKNTYLYCINHAYKYGGERIEVIKIQKENESNKKLFFSSKFFFIDINFQNNCFTHLNLFNINIILASDFSFKYEKSLILPEKLMGITNDLIVVGPHDDIYITTHLSIHDPIEGRDNSLMKQIRMILPILFKIKGTFIYHCETSHLRNINIPSHFKCIQTTDQESLSLLNNGIAYDEENDIIYVSNLLERRIRIFKRDPENKIHLNYLNDINIEYPGDNINFERDKEGNTILTVGVLGKALHHTKLVEESKNDGIISMNNSTFFGSVKIKIQKGTDLSDKKEIEKNTKIEKLVMQNDLFKGISSAVKVNMKVYMSSWCDDGLLICNVN